MFELEEGGGGTAEVHRLKALRPIYAPPSAPHFFLLE